MLFNNLKTSALIMMLAMAGTAEDVVIAAQATVRYWLPVATNTVVLWILFDMIGEIFTAPIYMNSMLGRSEPSLSKLAAPNSPSYDVSVNSETGLVELTVELPGVRSEDLDIELIDASLLRIRASRRVKQNGAFFQQEFDQNFQLDRDVDPNHITASLTNGILTVQAKRKEKSVKKIPLVLNDDKETLPFMGADESVTETTANQDTEGIVIVENDD